MIRQTWLQRRRAPLVSQAVVAEEQTIQRVAAPFVGIVFEWMTLAVAALVVGAVLVDALRLPVHINSVVLAAALLFVPLLIASWWKRATKGIVFGGWAELLLLGIVVVVGWQLLAPALPSWLPIGESPDAVHHTALANYIFEHQQLVHEPKTLNELLGEMVDYPPGFAALTALAAQATGTTPVEVIYPIAVIVVTAGVLGIALLIGQSVPRPVAPFAMIGAFAVILMPEYIFGIVASENYYPQAMAQWLIVVVGYLLLRQVQTLDLLATLRLGLLLGALLVVYTTWLPVALLAIVLSIFAQPSRWRSQLLHVLGLVAPFALLMVGYTWARATTGTAVVLHEGHTIREPLQATGVWLPVLAVIGMLLGWCSSERRVALGLLVAVIAHTAGLWLLWQQGRIAGYIYFKSYYLAALLLAVPIGWLIADVVSIIFNRLQWQRLLLIAQPIVILAAIAWAVAAPGLSSTARAAAHPLNAEVLEAGHWLRRYGTLHDAAYALQRPGLPAYWLHVGVLGQPRTDAAHALLKEPQLSFWEWYLQPSMPRMLLLEGQKPTENVAGLVTRFQNACCTVLEKVDGPEYTAALDQLQPLVVSYRVGNDDGRQQVHVQVFDQVNQSDLHLRLVLNSGEQVLVAPMLPVPQRAGRTQYMGFSVDPQTLATTGYANNEPEQAWSSISNVLQGTYRVRLELLHGDTVVDERLIGECCEAPGRWAVFQPAGRLIRFVPVRVDTSLQQHDFTLGSQIALVGSVVESNVARPGETITVRLRWLAREAISQHYRTFVQLIAADGGAAVTVDGEPNGGLSPMWRWQPGNQVDDTWQLKLPADLQPGVYQVVIGVYNPVDGQRLEAWRQSPFVERFWLNTLPLGQVEVRP